MCFVNFYSVVLKKKRLLCVCHFDHTYFMASFPLISLQGGLQMYIKVVFNYFNSGYRKNK